MQNGVKFEPPLNRFSSCLFYKSVPFSSCWILVIGIITSSIFFLLTSFTSQILYVLLWDLPFPPQTKLVRTHAWNIVMPKEVVLLMCAFAQQSNEEAVSVNTDGFSHQSYVFSSHIILIFLNPGRLFASNAKATVRYSWSSICIFDEFICFLWWENVPLSLFFSSQLEFFDTLSEGLEQAICCPPFLARLLCPC